VSAGFAFKASPARSGQLLEHGAGDDSEKKGQAQEFDRCQNHSKFSFQDERRDFSVGWITAAAGRITIVKTLWQSACGQ
jgi:hypothetical protein